MSLLIDADYLVYKCCAATETEIDFGEDVIVVTSKFSEAYEYVERELYNIATDLGCFDDSILFFSDSVNFRKSIDPNYTGGGYKGGKGKKQKSLEKWGKERWSTREEYEKGKKAKAAAKRYKDSK